MGMPLYLQQPPTGYKDTADAWVSTSGLLARLNFALDLAAAACAGVGRVDAGRARARRPVRATRWTLPTAAALTRAWPAVLGSPEFQRR